MKLRPLLELIRFPAVFTAPADVLCGLAIATVLGAPLVSSSVGLLLFASVCIYAAGMAANDIFDLQTDTEERPGRPIPSGRVSLTTAWTLVLTLQTLGLIASYVVGLESMACVAGTVLMTYLYNGVAKSTLLGPVFMGACRYGNALIGLSLVSLETAPMWSFLAPVTVAVYVAALTCVSRYEVGGIDAPGRRLAIVVTVLASIGPLALFFIGGLVPPIALIAVALPPLWLARSAVSAYGAEEDGVTRGFVLRSIHGIVIVNAVVAALVGHFVFATIIAVLLLPARLVGRWFYST